MSLWPTEAVLQAIMAEQHCCRTLDHGEYKDAALDLFVLIREMVLEAAAKECEEKSAELDVLHLGDSAMRTTWHEAAQAIRAMKGTP